LSDSAKRTLSFTIFGLGILVGIVGCIGLPMATFAAGENDSQPEVWAFLLIFGTPLPAFLIALWKRLPAGLLLTFVGLFVPFAMLYQRHYEMVVRHFPDVPSIGATLSGFAQMYVPFLALGIFALVTERLKWPRLIGHNDSIDF